MVPLCVYEAKRQKVAEDRTGIIVMTNGQLGMWRFTSILSRNKPQWRGGLIVEGRDKWSMMN
jgi:hypothetical protein